MTSVDNPAVDDKTGADIQTRRAQAVLTTVYNYTLNHVKWWAAWPLMKALQSAEGDQPAFHVEVHEVSLALATLLGDGKLLTRQEESSGAVLYKVDMTKHGPVTDVKKTRKIADRALTGKVMAALNKSRYRTVNEVVQAFPDLTIQQASAVLTRLHKEGKIKRSKGRRRTQNFRATWGYKLFAERPHYAGKGRTKDFLESAGVESETPPEGVVPVRDIEAAVTDLEFHLSLAEGRKKEVETEIAEKKAAREALLALM